MSTSLVPVDFSQLPSTQIGSDEDYAALGKSTQYLSRLQLYTKGGAIDKGLIKPGHYGIPGSGDEIVDLGDSIDILALARRPKALDMSDREQLITSYDLNSDEFKRIQAKSAEKESGCMYGTSFLVFERSSARFLEFFCGSKSLRNASKDIFPKMQLTQADIEARGLQNVEPHGPIPFTLKSKLVQNKFSWHVPVVLDCSVPIKILVSQADFDAEIKRFLNPKAEETEVVTESDTKKKRAR